MARTRRCLLNTMPDICGRISPGRLMRMLIYDLSLNDEKTRQTIVEYLREFLLNSGELRI